MKCNLCLSSFHVIIMCTKLVLIYTKINIDLSSSAHAFFDSSIANSVSRKRELPIEVRNALAC